jgi:hypothetical protein
MGLDVAYSFSPVHTALEEHEAECAARHNAILERITQVQAKQFDSENRICTAVYTALDDVLEAIPVQKPLDPRKQRNRSKSEDLRRISATHERKISISQSMELAKNFAQDTVGRTARFIRQASKPLHFRTPSASDAPAPMRRSFQCQAGEQLSYIPEQPPVASSQVGSEE